MISTRGRYFKTCNPDQNDPDNQIPLSSATDQPDVINLICCQVLSVGRMHTERGCTRTLEIVKSLLLYKLLSQFIRLPEMPDQVRLLKVSKPQCYSTERLPQGPKLGGLHSNTTHHNKYKVPTHTTAVGHCTHSHGTAIGTHKTPAGLHKATVSSPSHPRS